MLLDEIERIHQEILEFEMIEAVSHPMRELIEDLWLELVRSCRPRRDWHTRYRRPRPRGRTSDWMARAGLSGERS